MGCEQVLTGRKLMQCLPSPEDVKLPWRYINCLWRLKDGMYRLEVEHLLKISTSLSLPFPLKIENWVHFSH